MMKKMMIRMIVLSAAALLFALVSCTEVKDWSEPKDNVPPGKIKNVNVENIHGGARITYELPDDDDLLGVKAEYSFDENDIIREAYSSAYTDTIVLRGYSNMSAHRVKLYVLDKSMNESEQVEVTINPLIPPIDIIRNSLRVNPTFGGVYTLWENQLKEEVAISLMLMDSLGEYSPYDVHYTKAPLGIHAFRGLENKEVKIRLQLRDRWDNYSAPLDTTLTPLFEEQIVGRDDKTGNIWVRYGWADRSSLFRGDITSERGGANAFEKIFDGIEFNSGNWWHTGDAGNELRQFLPEWPEGGYFVMPIYLTIDMVKKASYSRLRYWLRNRNPLYSVPIFTSFEVWATNNPKPINEIGDGGRDANLKYWTQWPEVGGTDEWKNDWTKLADCVLAFPSGAPNNALPSQLTSEDQEFLRQGIEFEMDPQYANSPFRYIRLVIRSQNQVTSQIQLSELKFWGAYAE